jgi:hypothetical protein
MATLRSTEQKARTTLHTAQEDRGYASKMQRCPEVGGEELNGDRVV